MLDSPAETRCRLRRCALTSSTPEALWASRSVRLLRPAAVATRGLRRMVDGRPLLDGVDLSVPVGARLLIVAEPEEAASTLLRVLAGLLRPTSGTFELAGLSRPGPAGGWARRVAYIPPEPGIYPWLTAREAVDLAARLAGVDPADRHQRVQTLLARFRVLPEADRPLRRAGPIVAQKAAMAAALVAEPEVLLLDDPLRSLDPGERARLMRVPGRRRTVVLASRYPASEAGLVNQVALLRRGRLALHVGADQLGAHGLPLSLRGIQALSGVLDGPLPAAAHG
ncbi:MAG: ATP-binding cassette domain-containing protein [Candidatus Limnocylindria bacterium]